MLESTNFLSIPALKRIKKTSCFPKMLEKLNANMTTISLIFITKQANAIVSSYDIYYQMKQLYKKRELFTIGGLVEGPSHGVGQVRSLLQQSSPLSGTHVPVQWLLGWGGWSGNEVLHSHGVRGGNGRLVSDVQVQLTCGAKGHFSEIKVKVIGEITGKNVTKIYKDLLITVFEQETLNLI